MNIFILRFPYEYMNQIHACFFSYELRAYPTITGIPYLHGLYPCPACKNYSRILSMRISPISSRMNCSRVLSASTCANCPYSTCTKCDHILPVRIAPCPTCYLRDSMIFARTYLRDSIISARPWTRVSNCA